MRILLAAARFVVLVAFMPQSLMADLITTQQRVQCKPMHIYDPLGIRGCMRKYFDLCLAKTEEAEESVRAAAANFGRCMANSSYSWIFNPTANVPTRSEVCQHRMTTNIVVFPRFQECYKTLNDICHGWDENNRVKNLVLMIDGAKCLLEEQKLYRQPELWNLVACSAFEVLYDKTKAPILDALLELLHCKRPKPTVATAALRAPDC